MYGFTAITINEGGRINDSTGKCKLCRAVSPSSGASTDSVLYCCQKCTKPNRIRARESVDVLDVLDDFLEQAHDEFDDARKAGTAATQNSEIKQSLTDEIKFGRPGHEAEA